MAEIVGVRFERAGRLYYFDPQGAELAVGDWVVVETVQGRTLARVVIAPCQMEDAAMGHELKPIIRPATARDLLLHGWHRSREAKALERCRQKVTEHGLEMQVVGAEYSFDGERLTFYFTAAQRVDFRELVRDLAHTFRARIELRQLGPRDELKLFGGWGPCGCPLCCATWLTEFHPISIRMAKTQELPLNPESISGCCGRLYCCLSYEQECYQEAKARLPRVRAQVRTAYGEGRVLSVNVLTEMVQVQYADETIQEVSASAVEAIAAGRRTGERAVEEREDAQDTDRQGEL